MADITKLAPSRRDLTDVERLTVFEYFYRRLADHRNLTTIYAEYDYTQSKSIQKGKQRDDLIRELNAWANEMLKHAWAACDEPGSGELDWQFILLASY